MTIPWIVICLWFVENWLFDRGFDRHIQIYYFFGILFIGLSVDPLVHLNNWIILVTRLWFLTSSSAYFFELFHSFFVQFLGFFLFFCLVSDEIIFDNLLNLFGHQYCVRKPGYPHGPILLRFSYQKKLFIGHFNLEGVFVSVRVMVIPVIFDFARNNIPKM